MTKLSTDTPQSTMSILSPFPTLDSKKSKDNNSFDSIKVVDEDLNDNMDFISYMDKDPESFVNDNSKLTYGEAYRLYKANPNKKALSQVLHSLKDTINYSLASNNAIGDPLLESKAKLIAAKAIKEFDPGYNVNLPTYVSSQLRKMTRVARDLRNPIKIPERYIYEAQAINQAEQEFIDKHGRDPDLTELSDAAGISLKKLVDIRNKSVKQVSENQMFTSADAEDESQGAVDETAAQAPDFVNEAQLYVYNDLDHKQKKVFEHLTGFGGAKILSPQQISQKYNVSLPTISRLANRFAKDLNQMSQTLEEVYAS